MTTPPRESWEGLQQSATSPEAIEARRSTAEMVMAATTSAAGRQLVEWLRSITIEKRNRPAAAEPYLRELEAQRALVALIEQLRDEGSKIVADRSKAASK